MEPTVYAFPSLPRRVKSSLIDVVLLMVALLPIFSLMDLAGNVPVVVKVLVMMGLVLYEPVLTWHSATVGQRLMGIRVRAYGNREANVGLGRAILRYVAKLALGWLSYLTIHFNAERRALHDMIADSVMVETD